ncbi:cytochrome P450 [Xylariomycetidae sp. FL2044]|nr:cytochrome P450 [Xylariomycetidae sp. FL2044]
MSHPIPRPPGVPLVGNIFDVDPSNTWASLKKLAENYGEIFQIKVLGQTLVFVAGAALAEELCDERRFRKFVGGPIVEIRYAVHDALFTAYEHEKSWGVAHRIIAPRLAPQALAGDRFTEILTCTNELLDKWKGLAAAHGSNASGSSSSSIKVCAVAELNRLSLEATTLSLYGKKLNCLSGPEHPMIKAMEDATSEAMKRPTRPALLNWLVYGGKFKSATAEMRAYAAEMVQHRRANPSPGRQDVLSALLDAADPETGTALNASQVIDEIVSMPIGSSTAPALLATAIYFLLRNPEVVARARQELDAVVGGGGGGKGDTNTAELQYAHLARLPYVEGIFRESLRLSFAAPGFNIEPRPREGANNDNDNGGGHGSTGGSKGKGAPPVLLGGGKYAIAADQAVIVVLAGVNRDPTVFDSPLAFRPERMMGEAFARLPAGVKKWFGNGRRECIGRHWAWLFGMTALAELIRRVDFEMVDPNYELAQDGWFNLRPVDFFVRVKVRGG